MHNVLAIRYPGRVLGRLPLHPILNDPCVLQNYQSGCALLAHLVSVHTETHRYFLRQYFLSKKKRIKRISAPFRRITYYSPPSQGGAGGGSIFFSIHLPYQHQPDDGRRQGLQGVRFEQLLPDETREEDVAGAERGEDEGIDEEHQCPASAAPRGCGVPHDEARHRGDVAVALCAGREERDEHRRRGQHGIAEGDVLVLADAAEGREEQQDAGDDEPQVAVLGVAADLTRYA